jgi:hypothetical protein
MGCASIAFAESSPAESSVETAVEGTVYYFGKSAVCKKDSGFVLDEKQSSISKDNPHYGWRLGQFYITGYSDKSAKEDNVYLRTVGDKIEFGFKLEQFIDFLCMESNLFPKISKLKEAGCTPNQIIDILDKDDVLDKNKNMSINDDNKSYVLDPAFPSSREKADLGRGTLIIVKTDHQGKSTQTEYTDFLTAKDVNANTKVDIFEEGDYRVVLVYEIQKKGGPFGTMKSYSNYRIDSSFKIRNGNSMVFLMDANTGVELANKVLTENGFKVDMAQSHYLHVSVKKEIPNDTQDGFVEDTRFNVPVSDGKSFTDPGKYTITVSNDYTDGKTEKTLYVGKAIDMSAAGATVADDGTVVELISSPSDNNPTKTSTSDDDIVDDKDPVITNDSAETPISDSEAVEEENSSDSDNTISRWLPIVLGTLVILVIVLIYVSIARKKKHGKEASQQNVTKEDNQL